MLRLVIFDFDQTLVDTLSRFYHIFNIALKNFGCENIGFNEFMEDYKRDSLNEHVCVDPKEFWDYFLLHYNDIECEKDAPIEGSLDVLRYLKNRKINVVVATGRMVPSSDVWKELEKFGMAQYVDFVYTRLDKYGDGRRRMELINEAMERFGADKEETIFVGDYWPDMQSGRAVGVYTVGVLTGMESEEKLLENGANIVIPSVKHLIKVIEERF